MASLERVFQITFLSVKLNQLGNVKCNKGEMDRMDDLIEEERTANPETQPYIKLLYAWDSIITDMTR